MPKRREMKGALGRLSFFGARPVNRDAARLMRRLEDEANSRPLDRTARPMTTPKVIDGWSDMSPEQRVEHLRRLNKVRQ